MASAADLSGRMIRVGHSAGPTTIEIISGSVSDVCDTTSYLPNGSTVKRTVAHGRLVTYSFQGAILTTALPFSSLAPGTAVSTLFVEPTSASGSSEHASSDAVVQSMTHTFDTSTHQVFDVVLVADGNYTPPS